MCEKGKYVRNRSYEDFIMTKKKYEGKYAEMAEAFRKDGCDKCGSRINCCCY
ncbi:hypothetical protein SAMN02910358_01825 [Lachnospiraceae bacterium XBB1006]|nr:hypothetical protein SAMN02910358_01825 [Lachnospiraceae bacterium XBB1006]